MRIALKTNKGITMVSLVIIIIVLVILAGISVNMTVGENGIITIAKRAKRAKENIELAQIEEQTKLNELYTQLESNDISSPLEIGLIKQTGQVVSSDTMLQKTYLDIRNIKTITLSMCTGYNNVQPSVIKVVGYGKKEDLTEGTEILSYTGTNYGPNKGTTKTIDVSMYEAISIENGAATSGVCSMYVIDSYTKR